MKKITLILVVLTNALHVKADGPVWSIFDFSVEGKIIDRNKELRNKIRWTASEILVNHCNREVLPLEDWQDDARPFTDIGKAGIIQEAKKMAIMKLQIPGSQVPDLMLLGKMSHNDLHGVYEVEMWVIDVSNKFTEVGRGFFNFDENAEGHLRDSFLNRMLPEFQSKKFCDIHSTPNVKSLSQQVRRFVENEYSEEFLGKKGNLDPSKSVRENIERKDNDLVYVMYLHESIRFYSIKCREKLEKLKQGESARSDVLRHLEKNQELLNISIQFFEEKNLGALDDDGIVERLVKLQKKNDELISVIR